MGSGTSTSMKMSAANYGKNNKKFLQCYMLTQELGRGAFSTVKLAVHMDTGHKTAVKIVSKKKLSEEDYASLLQEIEILSILNHPHIIKLYETFDEGMEFYIVTELVEGGELFDRIVSKSHYTEKEARDLIKMLLETMAYMHGAGIVHRDLKPENLLLCSEFDDSNIKVADFGFAKRVADLSPKETACGTPGYVAPEILRGDLYGAEVDVWSMGVICYVLLAGYPPFYDDDQKRLFKKIKEGRYHFHEDYWSKTSPEAIHMIRCMLCVDQSKRWTAPQLLKHGWITLGDDVLQSKDLTGSITVMKKFNARRRFVAAANAVILTNRLNSMFGAKRALNGTSSPSDSGNTDTSSGEKRGVSMLDIDAIKESESIDLGDEHSHGPSAILKDLSNQELPIDPNDIYDADPVSDLMNDPMLKSVKNETKSVNENPIPESESPIPTSFGVVTVK